MAIDKAKADAIAAELAAGLSTASSVVGVIAPQYAAFALIGQAVAKFMPTLVDDAIALINKEEPTDQDLADFQAKLQALQNPAGI